LAQKAIILQAGTFIDATQINKYVAHIGVGASAGSPVQGFQTIDFAYNIRDLMNCINCNNGQTILDDSQNDLFSMKLDFHETGVYFDGNIHKETWLNKLTPSLSRNYTFGYDNASRLKTAIYAGGNSGENYSLDNINYDKNGNITNLQRKGKIGNSFGDIDNLSYVYSGNRLLGVSDAINTGVGEGDFKDNNSGTDYNYYADGSLQQDLNKGISNINYDDFLKKTSQVSINGNAINFYYDGSGNLLKRELSDGTKWEYYGGAVYKNNEVYQVAHDEGRSVLVNNAWLQEFEYRDHLNNLRLSFRDETVGNPSIRNAPTITQTADYEPFGRQFNETANALTKSNFKLNNKEKVEDFGLNLNLYKFRPYDDVILRLTMVDPLAAKFPYNSTYAYAENKVGLGFEYEGLELVEFGFFYETNIAIPRTGIIETATRLSIPKTEISVMNPVSPIMEKHHLSPNGEKGHEVVKEAREGGFKQDGKENKMPVEKYSKETDDGQHGSHPNYNKEVRGRLDKFKELNPERTGKESLDFVRGMVKELKETIQNNPQTKINDLFKTNMVAPIDATTRPQTAPVERTLINPNLY
jgi:YD repeat-containing protein